MQVNTSTELSIIIVSYNTKEQLKSCLQSICNMVTRFSWEIIAVDNASMDRSFEMIKCDFPQVKILANDRNVGFGAANNQGLSKARGRYILFLNPDVIVWPDAVEKILQFCEEHPQVGIVGCKILNPDGSLQPSCNKFPGLLDYIWESLYVYKIFPRNKFIGRFHMTYFDYDKIAEVDCVKGAFMMLRREVLDDIKGFDEDFFIFSEEMDLCYRAQKAGWKIVFYPDAQITHYGGQSVFQESEAMFIEMHKSRFQFISKHHSILMSYSVKSLLFLGVVLRTVAWSLKSMICPLNDAAEKKMRLYWNTLKWYLGMKCASAKYPSKT